VNPTWLFVAVVWFAAAALARRVVPWRIAALFYVLVLAFLFRPMTGPYNNVAPDVLGLVPPWRDAGFDKYQVSNYELQDVMFELAPWTHQVHEQWRELRVPLWNPLSGSGMPLLANMQSAALSPLRLATIPLPLAYAMTAEAAMKILIALTFTFLYCRKRGYDEWPSVIGAISFGFGTFVLTWLHYPLGATGTFLPAVLYAIDLLAEKRTFGRFVFAAALGPLLLSQGHPESVAHIAFFAAVYALVTARHAWKRLGAAMFVSILLAAPILAPFLEAVPHTIRWGEKHASATPFSDFPSLALLVLPRLYGDHPGAPWGPAVAEAVSGFAGILGIGAWLGLLVRAIRQRRFREREFFFVVATAVVFLLLADVPYVSAPFRALFSMALNARLRLIFSFLLAVQAAAWVHLRERRAVAIAGALIVLAFVLLKTHFPNADARQFALMTAIPSAIVLVAATLRVHALLALAVFAELWCASARWNPVRRGTDLYPRTPMIDALQKLRTSEPYRIAGLAPLFPNTNALFGFEDVRVHDPMANRRYLDVLPASRHTYFQTLTDVETPLMDFLNVRWILASPGEERPRYRLVYDGADGRIFENPYAMPRFFSREARVTMTMARGDAYELEVDAPRDALVLSSIAFWPGWRVTYNGRTLHPRIVERSFVGFTIPPGRGMVRVRYVPWTFWGGVIVAGLAVIGLCIAGMVTRSRGRAVGTAS